MKNTSVPRSRRHRFVAAASFLVLTGITSSAQGSPEFSYTGDTGPGAWGDLSPSWRDCATDTRQSPINIEHATRDSTLGPLTLALRETAVKLTNNGHTIEQEYEPGSSLTFEGVTYELSQFHFHTLSEHTLNGKRGAMELHAVFSDAATGNKAVIGQLYEIGITADAFLAQIADALPQKTGEETSSAKKINLTEGFKNTKGYYTYPGSLTTPACSPVVTWIVLKTPSTLTEAQFRKFNRLLGHNFRPLQDLNRRAIRSSRE